MILQQLLAEAGIGGIAHELVSVDAQGAEAAADWGDLRSPENYLGDARTENFASPAGSVVDRRHVYTAPARFSLNHWALAGEGAGGEQDIALPTATGRIAHRLHARRADLVRGHAVRRHS